jgi:transglutaminase-like putative cysteine protease
MDQINKTFFEYLKPSQLCNFDEASEIKDVALRLVTNYSDSTQKANCIYNFVKIIPFRYDDWNVKASDILLRGSGMCSGKTNLLVAMLRSIGIPSRYIVLRCRGELELYTLMTKRNDKLARMCGTLPEVGNHVLAEVYLGKWIVYEVARDPTLEQGLIQLGISIEFQPIADNSGTARSILSNFDTWASKRQESIYINENRQEILDLMNQELDRIRSKSSHNINNHR